MPRESEMPGLRAPRVAGSTNAMIPLAPRGLPARRSAPRTERPGRSNLRFPRENTCNALDRDGHIRSRDDVPSIVSRACWWVHSTLCSACFAGRCKVDGIFPCPFTGISAPAVIGPAFTPGWPRFKTLLFSHLLVSRPFTGVLLVGRRRPVNGPDKPGTAEFRPDVNVGPNTAFGGKGRKRPYKVRNAPSPTKQIDQRPKNSGAYAD